MSTQVGQNFGNARLERLLGRGFLGESYLARQVATGRQVVVKVLHDNFSGGRRSICWRCRDSVTALGAVTFSLRQHQRGSVSRSV